MCCDMPKCDCPARTTIHLTTVTKRGMAVMDRGMYVGALYSLLSMPNLGYLCYLCLSNEYEN